MTTAAVPAIRSEDSVLTRLLRTTLLIGVIDGLWAVVLTFIYGRPIAGLFPGIAATLFGERMATGGTAAQVVGVLMHFGVAFTWTAVFLLFFLRSAWIRRVLDSPYGVLKVAAVYGPMIWIVMSAVVIPLLLRRPLAISGRWWIQLAGHVVFVGMPIVWGIAKSSRH